MDPSPHVVLLTIRKINDYLEYMNQGQSYISELWVFRTLKEHISTSLEVGLMLSDCELSDRVATIAIRRIHANIVTATRHINELPANLARPYDNSNVNFSETEAAQIMPRGEFALRERKNNDQLPDRQLKID